MIEESERALVVTIDPATKDNIAYWAGRLRPETNGGGCRVQDLVWDKFALPKRDADAYVQKRLLEDEKDIFDRATDIDIELQNPTQFVPGAKRLFAGNIRSHTLSRSLALAIRARRRALGLPEPNIRFSHPRTKFFTLGFDCPKKKSDRKRLSVKIQDAFFRTHSNDRSYDSWRQRYETHFLDPKTNRTKKDDAADVRTAGIARFVRMRAGLDRKKRK